MSFKGKPKQEHINVYSLNLDYIELQLPWNHNNTQTAILR